MIRFSTPRAVSGLATAALTLCWALTATAQITAQITPQATVQAQDAADRLLAAPPAPDAAPPPTPDVDREAQLRALGESYRRAPDEQQDPQELVRTRILNAEILAQNALAENQERADRDAYEAAAARHSEALSRSETERLNYEADLRAAQAAQARHDSDMAAWRARVRACEAGDRRACQGW